jgi:hypothetical protein
MMIIAMKFLKAYDLGNQKHKKIQFSIQLRVKAFGSHLSICTNIIVQIMQSYFMNQGFKT